MTLPTMTATDNEVSGAIALAMVKGMRGLRKRHRQMLDRHGLDAPNPDQWYPQDDVLAVFEAIAADAELLTYCEMGTQVAHDADFPPEVESIEQALSHADALHRDNHRGRQVGSYTFQKTGENTGTILCNTPYPCDFDRGLVEGIARRFRPDGAWNVTVRHDGSAPCRKRGDDGCGFVVAW